MLSHPVEGVAGEEIRGISADEGEAIYGLLLSYRVEGAARIILVLNLTSMDRGHTSMSGMSSMFSKEDVDSALVRWIFRWLVMDTMNSNPSDHLHFRLRCNGVINVGVPVIVVLLRIVGPARRRKIRLEDGAQSVEVPPHDVLLQLNRQGPPLLPPLRRRLDELRGTGERLDYHPPLRLRIKGALQEGALRQRDRPVEKKTTVELVRLGAVADLIDGHEGDRFDGPLVVSGYDAAQHVFEE